jgi:hypothetical protein
MWQCAKCDERLYDNFDVCWRCGTSKDGVEDPNFRIADDIAPEPVSEAARPEAERPVEPARLPLLCVRCHCKLDFVGTKAFHEGTRWGARRSR